MADNNELFNPTNFIHDIIDEQLEQGQHKQIITRFPPEPNGYLHIGHAKSIALNFGTALKYGGQCHLRMDDTNPSKEDVEYVDSIMEDVKWLGFDWGKNIFFASDYYDKLHAWAIELIKAGKAYVCELTPEETRAYRGTPTEPGKNSPYRDRTAEENLDQFTKMTNGEFKDGSKVLRAKIDMSSPNLNMRDPILYRIKHANHHRTGDKWCVYPMYDFTHGQSDAIEGITHSICTLEFEDHRPLYEWYLNNLSVPCKPQQIEFARLNLTYTVMSKRKLLELVESKMVSGWDDPRMPTISGLRRRGYTPNSIRMFCDRIGVAKTTSMIDSALLDFCLREDLNKVSQRVMAVLDPLKVTITNYPDDQEEMLDADNNPENEADGKRQVPFSKEIYIEKSDFMEDAPKKFFRLSVGKEVRLKHAYYVTCTEAIKDSEGNIVELLCTYDPATKGGWSNTRKVKGTLHWVSIKHAKQAEIRNYDKLFIKENMDDMEEGKVYQDYINPESLVVSKAFVEPGLCNAEPGVSYQFIRNGYYCVDNKDHSSEKPVFNKTIGLKDKWSKMAKKK